MGSVVELIDRRGKRTRKVCASCGVRVARRGSTCDECRQEVRDHDRAVMREFEEHLAEAARLAMRNGGKPTCAECGGVYVPTDEECRRYARSHRNYFICTSCGSRLLDEIVAKHDAQIAAGVPMEHRYFETPNSFFFACNQLWFEVLREYMERREAIEASA